MAEDSETSHLDENYASQVDYVYDRPVCFQIQSACVEVESWYLTNKGWEVLQDSHSVGEDRKCNRQAIKIHDRIVLQMG